MDLQERVAEGGWQLGDLTLTTSQQASAIVEQLEQGIVSAYRHWYNLSLLDHTALIVAELWRRVDTLEASLSLLSGAQRSLGEEPLLANYALLAVGASVDLSMTSASFGDGGLGSLEEDSRTEGTQHCPSEQHRSWKLLGIWRLFWPNRSSAQLQDKGDAHCL